MIVDKNYCMSSFLMLRTIYPKEYCFAADIVPVLFEENADRTSVYNSEELEEILRERVEKACQGGKAALALSGGIDSAILAKFMPAGSTAYTFKNVVPGMKVTDETPVAAQYAKECLLKHKIIEICWEDYETYAPLLMKRKGAPIHSIEVQIYKAAVQAKADGFDTLIFGESADVNFGGQDGLLSKDWTVAEYLERYSYLLPYKVLKQCSIISEPFVKYSNNGYMDVHEFNRHVYYCESMGSYHNAMDCAGVGFEAPFSKAYMGCPMDYQRVRNGENKYWVREIFRRLYPDFVIPAKVPMPRPMNEWFKAWAGPVREEFLPNCVHGLTGDQKWLIWCLEKFLNLQNL